MLIPLEKGCFDAKSNLFQSEIDKKNQSFENQEYQQHFLENIKREIIIFCLNHRLDELDELAAKYKGNVLKTNKAPLNTVTTYFYLFLYKPIHQRSRLCIKFLG